MTAYTELPISRVVTITRVSAVLHRDDACNGAPCQGILRSLANNDDPPPYVPLVRHDRVERLRRWHEEVSESLHGMGPHDVEYLGLRLHVPAEVFPPTPTSDLLGRLVTSTVQAGHRVLDMGCGSGANAILAAQRTDEVVAVDINPNAVAATAANA